MTNSDPFKKAPNRIGILIENSGKTLKEISKEIGINYATLSAYKRQIRYPKREKATKLADYFGVSIPYLLGTDDEPTNNNLIDNNIFSKLVIENGKTLKEKVKKLGLDIPPLETTIKEAESLKQRMLLF